MAKSKTVFVCTNCGAQASKWAGKCNVCGTWNSIEEEQIQTTYTGFNDKTTKPKAKPFALTDIEIGEITRTQTGNSEFDRVLGGGFTAGAVVLMGGEPGIGKSTLALQAAVNTKNLKTLYVSGEESLAQIKMRADRLNSSNSNCIVLSETLIDNIIETARNENPDILVLDSIQTVYTERSDSLPGSVSQIRECAAEIIKYAKENAKPALLIGHINKDGNLAGPKVLEHIVDTVLLFEGDRNNIYRVLRSTKNRFGSTSEIGLFEMTGAGLRNVENPSELLITHTDNETSGVCVSASMEGIRPFLIEVQALVSSAAYGNPQRSATGFDLRRLGMLLAVLEKRAGFRLTAKDVFLNIAGGIRVDDPAIDLAVVCSVLSSDLDIAVPRDTCFAGEVGLSGEIRPVTRFEQRISEASKMGFRRIFISKFHKNIDNNKFSIEIVSVGKIEEVFRAVFK